MTQKKTMATIDQRIGHLDFHSSFQQSSEDRLQLLLDNVSKREKIEIDYTSHGKIEGTKRIIDPIGIFFSMANWYLIAFCNTKNDYRTFKVNRIGNIKPTGYSINKEHPSLDSFLKELKDRTDLQKVIIEISTSDLPIIDESKYYQGLVSEETSGDRVKLHFMTFSLNQLGRWYLSYMDVAKIVYPEKLKLFVADIIRQHLAY